ncbi:MAG: putative monocarboxylate transporter mch1 [Sclerophora amabilis]|nr:MAG: putative monocarboxylate transporter mch1 [Sclerophora amabilis]
MSSVEGVVEQDNGKIDEQSALLQRPDDSESGPSLRGGEDEYFTANVEDDFSPGEGTQWNRRKNVVRYLSFVSAILSCLCAGSITAYSLYGPLFLSRLRYTQFQVNVVSIGAELSMYLPVPLVGYLCDRYNPRPLSLLASCFFGFGYLLAAGTYHQGPPPSAGGSGWPFPCMVVAFVFVGAGTSCMYLSAVTTCAKNFGRGKHKGIALAIPISAFGLSGMWQSQVGSRLLYEPGPHGERGDVDVFRYFLFLGVTLLVVGFIGSVALRVVDEEEMIDEAVEEMESSGLLEESAFFQRGAVERSYGTLADDNDGRFSISSQEAEVLRGAAEDLKRREEEEEKRKKTWLLNAETRHYLSDHTMWWLAAGFFLVTGPGEAFINNLGTILGTLSRPETASTPPPTTAATHVSIVAISSTVARLLTGTISDLFAPQLQSPNKATHRARAFTLPRPFLLIFSACLLSLGQVLLASGFVQSHASPRFGFVSALIGAGYGAVFSIVPIIISVVWGVENFGTNWGIVAVVPAFGALAWGVIYSAVYEAAVSPTGTTALQGLRGWTSAGGGSGGMPTAFQAGTDEDSNNTLCFGTSCYAPTFWAMAISVWVACAMWTWAWKGPGGWSRRRIAV